MKAFNKKKYNSLTVKLTLFALIPILITTLIFVYQMVWFLNDKITEDTKVQLNNMLNDCNLQLETAALHKMVLVQKTAHCIQTVPTTDTAFLINTLMNNLFIDTHLYGASVILKTTDSKKRVSYTYVRCYEDNNKINSYVLTGIDSITFIKRFPTAEDYLLEPERTAKGVWSRPFYRKSEDSAFVITYSEPFFNNGVFKGITSVDILISNIDEFLNSLKQFNEYQQELLILSENSILIFTRRHPEFIGKTAESILNLKPEIYGDSLNLLKAALKHGSQELTDYIDPENKQRYLIYYKYSNILGWKIISYTHHGDIMHIYRPIITKLVFLLITAVVIVLIISVYVTRNLIVNPLKKMSRTTDKIAGGDYSYKVKIKRNDEIGQLADNFRLMVEKLKEREEKLKQKNLELKEANKKLTELDVAKSQFLNLISHEIRTPLNGIVGSTYFLSDMNRDENLKEFIEMLKESVDRLERVATNSLFITQLKTTAHTRNCEKLRATKLIGNSLEKIEDFAKEQKVEIKTDIKEKFISACEDVAEKAITEVVHNAVKFSEDKKVEIQTTYNDRFYTLAVINKGNDIPKEKLDKITEPFGLASYHTDKNFGLGLSIANMCMEIMKGNLTVESDKGKIKVELTFNVI